MRQSNVWNSIVCKSQFLENRKEDVFSKFNMNLILFTQQVEIQLSVIHNYASHYLGLVIGSENPAAKSDLPCDLSLILSGMMTNH